MCASWGEGIQPTLDNEITSLPTQEINTYDAERRFALAKHVTSITVFGPGAAERTSFDEDTGEFFLDM